jgi:hypothetical protein
MTDELLPIHQRLLMLIVAWERSDPEVDMGAPFTVFSTRGQLLLNRGRPGASSAQASRVRGSRWKSWPRRISLVRSGRATNQPSYQYDVAAMTTPLSLVGAGSGDKNRPWVGY